VLVSLLSPWQAVAALLAPPASCATACARSGKGAHACCKKSSPGAAWTSTRCGCQHTAVSPASPWHALAFKAPAGLEFEFARLILVELASLSLSSSFESSRFQRPPPVLL
jgi:hypothetical protein